MTQRRRIEVDGVAYELDPQPVRTSLSDDQTMLWGLEVRVLRDGQALGVKTCFVGRVSVQFRDAEALDRPVDELAPVLHELAFEKISSRLSEGETGDEILFV